MRCVNCGNFSLKTVCKTCANHLQSSSLRTRILEDEFKIYSFFDYSEIKNLLASKHKFHGNFVYKILANLSFKQFAKEFKFGSFINAVAIDDRVKFDYSHTAILARALKNKEIKPLYASLHATSNLTYAGKNLAYRLKNPRNFKINKKPKFPVILVDDIITTGTTILEAKNTLEKAGVQVLFALVLADAKY
ncbi:ComF family protein [Campylobacter sp. RM16187]|uniref:ComF family protein n=1 Tax=Campylobacter sp. RM16187 TaxID=1660063 RepID=UPI0021B59538|nr:ComF family protein [Campylobacter sp. RM16187]QKG28688.1 transformation system, predicted amidophosphoribosyltransferase CtsW [Campylobacter sp. RM16187]